MVAMKPFAWAELVMGVVLILVSLLWCNFVPSAANTYLYWYVVIALSIVIIIIAALRLVTKT
jgi:hypothetical protein